MNMRKIFCIGFIISIILIISTLKVGRKDNDDPYKMTVVTKKVAIRGWQSTLESYGTVKSIEATDISTDISGKINRILFDSGDKVAEGTLLVELENDDLKAALQQDQAKFILAKSQLDKITYLYNERIFSRIDYETAFSNYSQDLAQVRLDEAQLKKTLIIAPFSGTIGLRNVNIGQYISPGNIIANIQREDQLYIDFLVPQDDELKIKVGDGVELQTSDHSKIVHAIVSAIDSNVNNENRMLMVRATISRGQHIIPGTYALVHIYLNKLRDYPTVPEEAIVYAPSSNGIYLVKQGRVQLIPIKMGARRHGEVQVLSKLTKDEQVVVSDQSQLYPNALVSVIPS